MALSDDVKMGEFGLDTRMSRLIATANRLEKLSDNIEATLFYSDPKEKCDSADPYGFPISDKANRVQDTLSYVENVLLTIANKLSPEKDGDEDGSGEKEERRRRGR